MARPPGKKNSSLALLSGGEKALTALALVFAIFRLNPAPFCVLDEVDAPLDDANVQRYCNLVKELSEHVQFIYITHNKLAMTMATDLLGVTMPEPGTSKLVTVNLEQAKEYGLVSSHRMEINTIIGIVVAIIIMLIGLRMILKSRTMLNPR